MINMNKEKIQLVIIAIIIAFILQFINMSTLENSIVGNIPIIGNILMFFDVTYIFKYAHEGFSPDNGTIFFMRFLSVAVSLITASYLLEFKSIAKVSNNQESIMIGFLFFIIAIAINFGLMWIMQSLYLSIIDVADRVTDEVNKINIGY